MPRRDVVVIGFSAGGVEALARIAADLPREWGALRGVEEWATSPVGMERT